MSTSSSIRGHVDSSKLPLYSNVATVDEPSTAMVDNIHGRTQLRHAKRSSVSNRCRSLLNASTWSCPKMPTKARFLADFTLGFADGLTVPFALTAGLSSLGRTETVVYAGAAEICAGSISMGIGGYLSARGDGAPVERIRNEIGVDDEGMGDAEKASVSSLPPRIMDYLRPLELPPALFDVVVEHVRGQPHISDALAARSEHDDDEDTRLCSPIIVGLSVSLGYLLGGILPLFPYFVVDRVGDGLFWSFGVCLVALFAFGFIKDFVLNRQRREEDIKQARFGKRHGVRWAEVRHSSWEGLQMVFLGGVAALAAVLCVRAFEGLRETSSTE